jgi:nitrate/TMAO reductase-like tetraheme cytochrome c subunit/mono/diheme cytochrome c family protein
MSRFTQRLKLFFFPPEGSPRLIRVLPYAVLGGLTLLVLIGSAYAWDYTNSPAFCGTTCHTMPPEYTAYLTSPHARIDCVDCHIGKGFIATRITRKAGDIKHIVSTLFQTYQYPIEAHDMRPARETCEKCHFPEKFSDDSLHTIKTYQNDRTNTMETIYLVLKTGGGSKRLGLGKGIHWHIENQVYFYSTDPEEQNIPYIKVVNDDGSTTEYVDINSGLDPTTINQQDLKEMDCITCHNRITHEIYPPEETVDNLMTSGIISTSIPDIHTKALEVYTGSYSTVDMAKAAIAGLTNYYTTYYPDYYVAHRADVEQAIAALQQAYQNSFYPSQNTDWTSHPNNVGHKDSAGCFRCHDGKHLDAQGEAIRLECNLCHSIPVVSGPNDLVANLEISRGPEPASHLNPNWISLHHDAFDGTCANCHTTQNPGGTDNSSFCSNSACHGNVWKYAGFDAPGLRQILIKQLPPTPTPAPTPAGGRVSFENAIGPLFQAHCTGCHGENGTKGLNLGSYQTAMAGGEDGPVIIPGDPQNSLLIQKQSGSQPHFGQLSTSDLEMVTQWIEAGAPEK